MQCPCTKLHKASINQVSTFSCSTCQTAVEKQPKRLQLPFLNPPPTLPFLFRNITTFSVPHPFAPPYPTAATIHIPSSHTTNHHTTHLPVFSTSHRHTLSSPTQVTTATAWPRSLRRLRCCATARARRNYTASRCCGGETWCLTVRCSIVCRCMPRMGSCCRR